MSLKDVIKRFLPGGAVQPQYRRLLTPSSIRPVQLRAAEAAGEPPAIEGYGAVFYRAGDPGTEYWLMPNLCERIMPGAFDRALREDDVRGLFNHDPNHLLGRTSAGTMQLAVDEVGLAYRIAYDEADSDHVKVRRKVERGDLTGSSFSFLTDEEDDVEFKREGETFVVEIKNLRMFDTGPVCFPAYDGTSCGVRCRAIGAGHDPERLLELAKQRTAPKRRPGSVTYHEVEARCREIEARRALARGR
jgi:HK97 family phage prohead protease